METKNIMIVGVGGQGSLLASKLLGHLLLTQGYDVKVSEVHGMSQRGGSVVTYVRYGSRVASPVIDEGEADYIVSFELMEAARWLPFLKEDGRIANKDYYNKAQKANAACEEYAKMLVQNGQLKGIDAISGATINYNEFVEAVNDALAQAAE